MTNRRDPPWARLISSQIAAATGGGRDVRQPGEIRPGPDSSSQIAATGVGRDV